MSDHNLTSTGSNDGNGTAMLIIRMFIKRRMVAVKLCSAAVILSVGLSLTMKNVYTASTTILPPPREHGIGGGTAGAGGGVLFGGAAALMNAYLELYVTVFKSRNVVDGVIKSLDLQKVYKSPNIESTRRRVLASVKIRPGKDGTITVSVTNRDPQLAAKLANTFVEEMSRRSSQLYLTKAGTERSFLEHRMGDIRKELLIAEDKLKDFQEKHKTLRADGQASLAIEGIAKLRLEIVNKEVQLASLRNTLTDEHADVKTLQAAIARMKGQLGAMTGSGGTDNFIPSAGNVPAIMAEYSRLFRDTKILDTVYEQLSKQYELAKMNESRDSAAIQVIDEAIPPVIKSGPRRSRFVIAATLAAFFVSVVVIIGQELLSRLSPEDTIIVRELKESFIFWKRRKSDG